MNKYLHHVCIQTNLEMLTGMNIPRASAEIVNGYVTKINGKVSILNMQKPSN